MSIKMGNVSASTKQEKEDVTASDTKQEKEDVSADTKQEREDVSEDTKQEREDVSADTKQEREDVSEDTKQEREDVSADTKQENEDVSADTIQEREDVSEDTKQEREDVSAYTKQENEDVSADTIQEKQIKHYSSSQTILLVGEGNFSFAACLAREFGSAVNMVATSLDSKESLMAKYAAAKYKLRELEEQSCVILHEVDVHTMRWHPLLIFQLFDRIIFNFPHSGFLFEESHKVQIKFHQDLVRGYFTSACEMLTEGGEVHVTHKTAYPFSKWNIVQLAEEVGLYLVEEACFSRGDYPGYINKKGSGAKCNRTFRVGQCSTYKFAKLPRRSSFGSGFTFLNS